MNNVWLDSDTVRYESVQKINYCIDSRMAYSKEIRQLQGNTAQSPIGPTLRPNGNVEATKRFWKTLD